MALPPWAAESPRGEPPKEEGAGLDSDALQALRGPQERAGAASWAKASFETENAEAALAAFAKCGWKRPVVGGIVILLVGGCIGYLIGAKAGPAVENPDDKKIATQLEETIKGLKDKNKELGTKNKKLEDKNKELEETIKGLEDKNKELGTKNKKLEDKNKESANTQSPTNENSGFTWKSIEHSQSNADNNVGPWIQAYINEFGTTDTETLLYSVDTDSEDGVQTFWIEVIKYRENTDSEPRCLFFEFGSQTTSTFNLKWTVVFLLDRMHEEAFNKIPAALVSRKEVSSFTIWVQWIKRHINRNIDEFKSEQDAFQFLSNTPPQYEEVNIHPIKSFEFIKQMLDRLNIVQIS